jgi:ATP-dependent Clp protease ATP-binding subunit ClpA
MSYVGYGEGGVLQNFVKQNPDGVLILKKPELGHPSILDLLSEILQGSFTAGDGQMISTRGLFLFILTSVGCESGTGRIGFGSEPGDQQQQARSALEELFSPALASALGSIPVFHLASLDPSVLRNIFRLQVFHYGRARGIRVQVEEGVAEKIVSGSNSGLCGARGVLGRFRDLVEPLLEKETERIGPMGIKAQGKKLRLFLDPGGAVSCVAASVPPTPTQEQREGN